MKKSKWIKIRKYIAIVLLVALTVFVAKLFYKEVRQEVAGVASEDMADDSEMYSSYFEEILKNKMNHLERASMELGPYVHSDVKMSKQILERYRNVFSALAVVHANGEVEYDTGISMTLIQKDQLSEIRDSRHSVIFNEEIQDQGRSRYVVFCTPILTNGTVSGILEGMLKVNELTKIVEKWNYSKQGCVLLCHEDGDYITGSQIFKEEIASEADDFSSYISYCTFDGDLDEEKIENKMLKRQNIEASYRFNGIEYTCVLNPCSFSDWYLCFIEKQSTLATKNFVISTKVFLCLFATLALWIIFIGYHLIFVNRHEKCKEQLERYELLSELEKTIFFEYQFHPKKISFFGDTEKMFGKELKPLLGESVYDVYNYVHPDDASIRSRFHTFFDDNTSVFNAEIRIKRGEDYSWFHIVGRLLKDPHVGYNLKFIGKIENADQEITDERNLIQRAENDLLTGVLNKKTMEEKIIKSLSGIKGNTRQIFFMIDLDNFKNVNDKLGHIVGDKAIVDTAKRLSDIFKNNAYVGRLGGDEFAVLVKYDAFDDESLLEFIRKKADHVCEVNRRTYSNGEIDVSITSSVGVAIAPDQATDFETLYKMADKALYKSKNGGKNCYHIYQ